jgi:hypothetical protein
MTISAPRVDQSSSRATGAQDAALLTNCHNDAIGVVTRSEALVRRGTNDLDLPTTASDSTVVAQKNWFGAYEFFLLAPDGSGVELEPTNRFLSCSRER